MKKDKDKDKEKDDLDLKKLKDDARKYDFDFQKGKLNFDTPLNIVLRDHCKVSMSDLICRKDIKCTELSKDCSILILKDSIVLTEVINNSNITKEKESKDIILRKIEYSIIHDTVVDSNASSTLYLDLIKEMPPGNFEKVTLCFSNIEDTMISKHFIEKQNQLYWQKFFETNIPLYDSDYYQAHFFLTKLNRRGKEDCRVMVLTDKFILNIEYSSNLGKSYDIIKLHKPKWAVAIESFEELQVSSKEKKKGYLMLKIRINTSTNKKIVTESKYTFKNKSNTEFMFDNEQKMNLFIFQIKRLYFLHTKKYLNLIEK